METTTKTPSLLDILVSQGDLPEKTANEQIDQSSQGTFDAGEDPISAIIINAHKACTQENGDVDFNEMTVDLSYAISQLTRAKQFIERSIK